MGHQVAGETVRMEYKVPIRRERKRGAGKPRAEITFLNMGHWRLANLVKFWIIVGHMCAIITSTTRATHWFHAATAASFLFCANTVKDWVVIDYLFLVLLIANVISFDDCTWLKERQHTIKSIAMKCLGCWTQIILSKFRPPIKVTD